MTLLGKLVPLVILFLVLAFAAFIGYAAYTIATDVADKTSKKMEKKNVSFGKEGMKIGVKEIKTENYVDQTQKYDMLLPALKASCDYCAARVSIIAICLKANAYRTC